MSTFTQRIATGATCNRTRQCWTSPSSPTSLSLFTSRNKRRTRADDRDRQPYEHDFDLICTEPAQLSCEVRIQSHIFGLPVFRLRLIFSQLTEMTLCKLLNSLHRYRHLFSRFSSQQRCRLLYSLLSTSDQSSCRVATRSFSSHGEVFYPPPGLVSSHPNLILCN